MVGLGLQCDGSSPHMGGLFFRKRVRSEQGKDVAIDRESREIYTRPNGDVWSLARVNRRVVVRHQANVPSGGNITDAELLDFLKAGRMGPEKQELLRMIETLVDDAT
jgi:hypothetical protein